VVCREWAEQDLGPYYRDGQPTRRNIIEDRLGVRLDVGLLLGTATGTPLVGATVEIWHCDAAGRYSGYPPPIAASDRSTRTKPEYLTNQTFLRGGQTTDSAGMVEFHTIYPGWYPGRTVHIHVIARPADHIFISQIYFPDPLSDTILAGPPYRDRPGRDTVNVTDSIFSTGGQPTILDITPQTDGYVGIAQLHLPIEA
jgi:protocatechuate 3,4-dioxygenase beta subunit